MYFIAAVIFAISFVPENINNLVKYSNYFSAPRLVLCIIVPIIILAVQKNKEANRK